jgi:hypothetical protein
MFGPATTADAVVIAAGAGETADPTRGIAFGAAGTLQEYPGNAQ